MEARLPRFFFPEGISFFFALATTVSIEPRQGRPDISSLVQSRECAEAAALFVSSFGADLVAGG